MKRKQKDDIMGEDQSDLPVVEGMICCFVCTDIANTLMKFREVVQLRRAHRNKLSFTNYRREVLMSLQHLFIDV